MTLVSVPSGYSSMIGNDKMTRAMPHTYLIHLSKINDQVMADPDSLYQTLPKNIKIGQALSLRVPIRHTEHILPGFVLVFLSDLLRLEVRAIDSPSLLGNVDCLVLSASPLGSQEDPS